MIEVNAICLGRIEDTEIHDDYVILDTTKMDVIRLSKFVHTLGNIPVNNTTEEPTDTIKFYNAICGSATGLSYTDGINEDKHWVFKEIGHETNQYKLIENGSNPMVVAKVAGVYLVCTGKIGNGPFGVDKSVGMIKIFNAKGMLDLNNKLKEKKAKLLNAKVIQSNKKTGDGKPVIYVQSFAGGLHGLIETAKVGNFYLIETLLKNITHIRNMLSGNEYNTEMNKVCAILNGIKNNTIIIPQEALKDVGDLIVSGMGNNILDVDWVKSVLEVLNKSIKTKVENKRLNRYASEEAILQSIGKRCASALEEAPKQAGVEMTGKSVQYITKDKLINKDKDLLLMGIIRLNHKNLTRYMLAKVYVVNKQIKCGIFLTEDDRKTVVDQESFDTWNINISEVDSSQANTFCHKVRIKFSELAVQILRG